MRGYYESKRLMKASSPSKQMADTKTPKYDSNYLARTKTLSTGLQTQRNHDNRTVPVIKDIGSSGNFCKYDIGRFNNKNSGQQQEAPKTERLGLKNKASKKYTNIEINNLIEKGADGLLCDIITSESSDSYNHSQASSDRSLIASPSKKVFAPSMKDFRFGSEIGMPPSLIKRTKVRNSNKNEFASIDDHRYQEERDILKVKEYWTLSSKGKWKGNKKPKMNLKRASNFSGASLGHFQNLQTMMKNQEVYMNRSSKKRIREWYKLEKNITENDRLQLKEFISQPIIAENKAIHNRLKKDMDKDIN